LPNSLHDKLYEIAKSELRAAKILTKNGSYPQAIYFYAQAFEKATKSVVALYLIKHKGRSESKASEELWRTYGHKLMDLTVTIANILTERDNLYVSRGGNESDPLIQILNEAIGKIKAHRKDKTDLIAYYESDVRVIYQRFYLRLKENAPIQNGEHFGWDFLRKRYADPKTKYGKIGTLTQILFFLLEGMDVYTRYPMQDVNYNNVAFLSRSEIHSACLGLEEMIEELISLVPLVWEKIRTMSPFS
jgi:HEPN domain-containing protein